VQADEIQAGQLRDAPHCLIGIPEATESPNFWSSWAVAMNSWVWASTPTVPAPARAGRRRPARGIGDPDDLVEGVQHDPAHAGMHRPLDLGHRLVVSVQQDPLGWHPARSATSSSPPDAASMPRPSSCTQRATAPLMKALAA
jgi:hypothetical protein